MELVTLQENRLSRVYDFLEYDKKSGVLVHRQLENRKGKIFVRTRVRFFGSAP